MWKRVNIISGKEATIMSETPGGCEPEADENFTEEKVARVLALLAELSDLALRAYDRCNYAGMNLQMMEEDEKFWTLEDAIGRIKEAYRFPMGL